MNMLHPLLLGLCFLAIGVPARAQQRVELMPIGQAWAANSINTVVFRQDPITTHGDKQYAAWYDPDGRLIIATRTLGSPADSSAGPGERAWKSTTTDLRGNIKDAHNSISIMADGDGFLHLSWDHHGHPLRYARSKSAGALEFDAGLSMTGRNEKNVTYPQFLRLPNGNLVFLFRDGASGRGNLVVNHYDTKQKAWTQLHENLISGENQRNAYWQACVDGSPAGSAAASPHGSIHISWVWRETGDVATNHDLCYARSDDGGRTWKRSDGSAYALPITAATAETASRIPQRHELINQTSMCTDDHGRPIIATYFRPPGQKVVQYFVIHHDGSAWRTVPVTQRKTPFSLSGGGSKQIPISRPQVIARTSGGLTSVWMIFRDIERDSRVSVAHCADLAKPSWTFKDLTDFTVRYWEPSFDRVRWQRDGVLDLYVQLTGQGDAESLEAIDPQPAYVLEWKP